MLSHLNTFALSNNHKDLLLPSLTRAKNPSLSSIHLDRWKRKDHPAREVPAFCPRGPAGCLSGADTTLAWYFIWSDPRPLMLTHASRYDIEKLAFSPSPYIKPSVCTLLTWWHKCRRFECTLCCNCKILKGRHFKRGEERLKLVLKRKWKWKQYIWH